MRAWRLALLAWNGLRRTPLRFSLAALGVVIASAALVSMVAFALGVQVRAEAPFKTLGLLDVIQVTPKKEQAQKDQAPGDAVLDDDAVNRIAALPGVAAASPDFRVRGIKLSRGDKTETVIGLGLPSEVPLLGVTQDIIVAGGYFRPGEAYQVILSRRLAADLGFASPDAAVGQSLTLEASGLMPEQSATFAFQRKTYSVAVVGVFDVPELMLGPMSKAVVLPLELIREIPGVQLDRALDSLRAGGGATDAGYRRITVRVVGHGDLYAVNAAIQAMGYETRTLLDQLDQMRSFFVFIDVLLAAVGTIALVVSGLGILNTLLMCVLERQQEIGIYKAIGASDGDLVVLFLTEAGIIGLVGGLGGLLLGRCASWVLDLGINAYARHHGVTAYLGVFSFPLWLLASTILFSALISILAGVYPALRAARIDPIRSLRRE